MPNYLHNPTLVELNEFSSHLGSRNDLIQAAGGNTSLKDGFGNIFVKRSGSNLRDALSANIFSKLDFHLNRKIIFNALANNEQDPKILSKTLNEHPSIEASFHIYFSEKIVIHLHAINVIVWTIVKKYREKLLNKISDLPILYIPYCRPGFSITKKLHSLLSILDIQPEIIILENHGIIILGDNFNEINLRLDKILSICRCEPRILRSYESCDDNKRISKFNELLNFRSPKFKLINELARGEFNLLMLKLNALYPDHVVYLNHKYLILPFNDDIGNLNYVASNISRIMQYSILIIPNLGVLVSKNITEAEEEMLECWFNIINRIPLSSDIFSLTNEQVEELDSWESEKYRRVISNAS
jgi:rhamnose utilization protein RhaD (predicted bifunctional aldolase and dehydrogenase)